MFVGGCAVLGVGFTVRKLENPDTRALVSCGKCTYTYIQMYVTNYRLLLHCYQHLFPTPHVTRVNMGHCGDNPCMIFDALVGADARPQALLARAPDAV